MMIIIFLMIISLATVLWWSFPQSTVQASGSSITAATGISKAFGSNVTVGNMIEVNVADNIVSTPSYTVTDSLGNSYAQVGATVTSTNINIAKFRAYNILGGACTVTVKPNATANFMEILCTEVAGELTAASPNDNNHTNTGSAGGATNTGSVPVAGPNELILACTAMLCSVGGTWTVSGGTPGFAVLYSDTTLQASHIEMCLCQEVANSADTATMTFNGTGTNWASIGASYKPAVFEEDGLTHLVVQQW